MYKRVGFLVLVLILTAILIPDKLASIRIPVPSILGVETSIIETKLDLNTSPELASAEQSPQLSARAAFAYDLNAGTALYTKSFDEQVPVASLTKLATALTAWDFITPDTEVTVLSEDIRVPGTNLGLVPGERVKVMDLIAAMLIASSNDAAQAIARQVGGGSREKFVEMMNRKAETLNLSSTRFGNPVGLDSDNNYSSAHDLSKIVAEIVKNPTLSEFVGTQEKEIVSVDGRFKHKARTTNKLLVESPDEIIGIKTGFTAQAKGNLIIRAKRGDAQIISIVLGSDNREEDTRNLLNWVWSAYKW